MTVAGYRGFECQCSKSSAYGPFCEESADKCTAGDIKINHSTEVVPLPGYRGSDLLNIHCEEGFELSGQLPR